MNSAESSTSIEEFDLPKTIINRVLKSALPDGSLFQKDAKSAFTNDLAKQGNLKTITPDMIFKALDLTDLDHFIPKIKEALSSHKEGLKLKKSKKTMPDNDDHVNTPLEDSNMEDSLSAVLPETGDSLSLNDDDDSIIIHKT